MFDPLLNTGLQPAKTEGADPRQDLLAAKDPVEPSYSQLATVDSLEQLSIRDAASTAEAEAPPQAEGYRERQERSWQASTSEQTSCRGGASGLGLVEDDFAGAGDSPSYQSRVRMFQKELAKARVDLEALQRMAFFGIPDADGLRAKVWQLLLAYLPVSTGQWEGVLRERRAAYRGFCEELIVDPKKDEAVGADHPLSQQNDSKWNAYFKDTELKEQIERDVMRTHPDLHFFSGNDEAATRHRAEMKRALFIYAKLNPGLQYVQGMNELYAPLYYQFSGDPQRGAPEGAEADAFFCFCDLIAEFRDHYCQQLDNSEVGIKATLHKLEAMLRSADPELCSHLETNKVVPQFYAFRWLTLLLTQEFPFPDAVRLWDTLLADPAGRMDCLLRLCTAMLTNVREELLGGDFPHNLKLLQRYPPVDVQTILHKAASLSQWQFKKTGR